MTKEEFREELEDRFYNYGGYILLSEGERPTLTFDDEGEERTIVVKSLVNVCEYTANGESMINAKMIDENDEMWDIEDYIHDERDLERLIDCAR